MAYSTLTLSELVRAIPVPPQGGVVEGMYPVGTIIMLPGSRVREPAILAFSGASLASAQNGVENHYPAALSVRT